MSRRSLDGWVSELPPGIRDQVVGYALSVESALPVILKEAYIRASQKLIDDLVFIAGVRKLYSLLSSNFWVLDNSASLLQKQQVEEISIGSVQFGRGSPAYDEVMRINKEFQKILIDNHLIQYMEGSYSDVANQLKDGY